MIRILNLLLILPVIAFSTLSAQNTVNIGLLIQDKSDLAALHGAELAIYLANKDGGLNGRPFRLFTKSMEGPWGTGSKQAISLIWENNVCALVGSHDGRNAHLVEQASAKSIIPFISAWSSDPSLSAAFIPWFFNCVPDDDQQAEGFINEIFKRKGFERVTVISDDTYDSKQALKSYFKTCNAKGIKMPVSITFEGHSQESGDFIQRIRSSEPQCLILFCAPDNSLTITRLLKQHHISVPVYGSLFILNENLLSYDDYQEMEKILQLPTAGWSADLLQTFRKNYFKQYGKYPGMVAAYSFDATSALIEAIRISKSDDRENIQQGLSELVFQGVTGILKFGNLGIRLNACYFK